MNSVQFYHPPLDTRERYPKYKVASVATFTHSTVKVQDCNHASAHGDYESDDDYLPPLEEVFQTRFPTKASAKPFESERSQQHVEKPAPDVTGIHIDHTNPGLGDRPGGSPAQPVIIEDDELDSTDAETEAETTTSADIKSGSPERHTALRGIGYPQDPTSESSVSVHPSPSNAWYDVEDGRYIDENEPLPIQKPRGNQQKEEWEEEGEEMTTVVEGRKLQVERQREEDVLDEMAIEEPQKGQGVDTVDNSEDEDYTRDTDDEDDDEDEDFRPAKRQKIPSVSEKEALKPAREHNSKLDVGRPRRRTSPTFMQIEMDDRQSQTEDPRFIDNVRHDALPPSRSPSATAESALAAEYEEWPLHGFLKRTRIGSTMLLNLEFHLTHVPEHLELSGLSQALHSNIRTSAQHRTSHNTAAPSKILNFKSRHPTKRIQWTKEEDETLVKMRDEDGCSWEEISAALPFRTPGAIQVRYSTKLGGGTGSRTRRRPEGVWSAEGVSPAE